MEGHNQQALITSTIDGVIVSITHDASFLFGYLDPEELIGQNVRILVPSPYKVAFFMLFGCG